MCQDDAMARENKGASWAQAGQPEVVFCGKILRDKDFARIQKLIDSQSRATRQQIARETCRLFGWRRPNGVPPVRGCRNLLVRLERMGVVRLPAPRRVRAEAKPGLPALDGAFLLGPTPGWGSFSIPFAVMRWRDCARPQRAPRLLARR